MSTPRLKPADMQYLRAWYGSTPTARMCRFLRMSPDELLQAATALGLRPQIERPDPLPVPSARRPAGQPHPADRPEDPAMPALLQALREAKRLLRARDHLGALDCIDSAIRTYDQRGPE